VKTTTAPRSETLVLELRRGVLVLGVLGALREEHYAYSLRKVLMSAGLDIDEGTLYPLVRRIEDQGLLTSEWREVEGRRRRYYRISPEGGTVLAKLEEEWTALDEAVDTLLGNNV
jgi:DNA-binding PadR family transcriptional regulator